MTIKEQLHQVIDELDDERAREVLTFAMRATSRDVFAMPEPSPFPEPGVEVDRESLWQIARPVTADDPLWGIIGMIDDDGPTDMASNKHKYLAEVYGDLHEK